MGREGISVEPLVQCSNKPMPRECVKLLLKLHFGECRLDKITAALIAGPLLRNARQLAPAIGASIEVINPVGFLARHSVKVHGSILVRQSEWHLKKHRRAREIVASQGVEKTRRAGRGDQREASSLQLSQTAREDSR